MRFPNPGDGSQRVLVVLACALVLAFAALALEFSLSGCASRPVPDIAVPAPARSSAPIDTVATVTPDAVATETTTPASAEATDMRPPRAVAPRATPAAQIDPSPWIGRPLLRSPWPTRKVAITLDDGPSRNTAEVLAIFRRYHIRATFFYVGDRCPRYHKLVRQAFDAGFEIGDHTLDHHEISRESAAFDLREIDLGAAELERETGVRPIYMRPPAGHWDATTLRCISKRGMVMALWSLHGQDTGKGTHAAVIARHALANVHGGDIILLHETNPETVKALPVIIEGILRKGLKPVTLSALLTR